jgi:hypothetical protein
MHIWKKVWNFVGTLGRFETNELRVIVHVCIMFSKLGKQFISWMFFYHEKIPDHFWQKKVP